MMRCVSSLRNSRILIGLEEMIFSHKWFMKGVYTYKGGLTNEHVARKFGFKYKNIDLLIAARF